RWTRRRTGRRCPTATAAAGCPWRRWPTRSRCSRAKSRPTLPARCSPSSRVPPPDRAAHDRARARRPRGARRHLASERVLRLRLPGPLAGGRSGDRAFRRLHAPRHRARRARDRRPGGRGRARPGGSRRLLRRVHGRGRRAAGREHAATLYEAEVVKRGAEPSATRITMGERSALPAAPSTRALRPGDLVRLGVGCVFKGYYSAVARTAVMGEPTALQEARHAAILAVE